MGKKADKVVEGEDLNVLVGSMPLKGSKKMLLRKYIKVIKRKI